MKILKTLTLIACFASLTTVFGQEIADHAIGLRLGDRDGFGAEVSYQKSISKYNRLEFDLGWRDHSQYNAFKLAGIYQWIHQLDGDFNWYYGVGGGLGNVDFDDILKDDGLFIFGAGNIGIEYNFDIPLLLSLDFRPEVGLVGYDDRFSDNFDFDIALGIRYQF
jgi:hypothetical protein